MKVETVPLHPRPGDRIFGCVHKPDPKQAHFFCVKLDAAYEWILMCDACFKRYKRNAGQCPLGVEAIWGDLHVTIRPPTDT
jgi:hypothetical protein